MMTLEEAIKHCKDVALSCTNKECALEHFQLLKWLQEYSNMLEKQGEQNQKHFELKAGHWYICHRAFCCRADHLTVKEGERFMCEKDGIVKGFVIKEPEKYFKEVCTPAPMEDEQKSAWSEEDKDFMYDTLSNLTELKDRYGDGYGNVGKCIDWLKSLKDRVRPKQEWSDVDKDILFRTIDNLKFLRDDISKDPKYAVNIIDIEHEITWLKFLRPQTTWKPSDEQITQLSDLIKYQNRWGMCPSVISELLEQLKKLREE